MAKYIGITIGPIGDTLADASTPAALWFASSIFSDITKRLCEEIVSDKGFPDAKIISPFYEKAAERNDGIGKYHDRIVFVTNQYCTEKMAAIAAKIKKETQAVFPAEVKENLSEEEIEEFLKQYLQIHYLLLEEADKKGNPILTVSPYLDMLELMKTFPVDDSKNLIRRTLNGKKNAQNSYIKDSKLFTAIKVQSNQIKKKEGDIRTIEEIACCHGKAEEEGKALKRSKYYAVVQADGDSMSDFLQNLLEDEQITEFSKACLMYDEAAAVMIGEYGGMTIYAGGDDLLFLAPIVNTGKETVFALCSRINKKFQEIIREGGFTKDIPTVSFGISIQYFKFPLYEALANARKLLMSVAKKSKNTKNSMAIEVQKHSGKSVSVLVSNKEYELFSEIISISDIRDENTINSLLYTLENNRELLFVLNRLVKEKGMDWQSYSAAWSNFFDNPMQEEYKSYISHICEIYYNGFVMAEAKIAIPEYALPSYYEEKDTTLKAFLCLMQIQKFLFEKGDAE